MRRRSWRSSACRDVPSNLATAIRTAVVLVFAWGIALAGGEQRALPGLSARTYGFLAASGVATGVSWLAYFRALQLGPASRVAPIDKLSLPIAVALAVLFLQEPICLARRPGRRRSWSWAHFSRSAEPRSDTIPT